MAARKENSELTKMPGFFYCPNDTTGLVELTLQERINIVGDGQGIYTIFLCANDIDTACYLDNNNIPTHRKADVPMPSSGSVPPDLTGSLFLEALFSKETTRKEITALEGLEDTATVSKSGPANDYRQLPNTFNYETQVIDFKQFSIPFRYTSVNSRSALSLYPGVNNYFKKLLPVSLSNIIFNALSEGSVKQSNEYTEKRSPLQQVKDRYSMFVRDLFILDSAAPYSVIEAYSRAGSRRKFLSEKQERKIDKADHGEFPDILRGIILKKIRQAHSQMVSFENDVSCHGVKNA